MGNLFCVMRVAVVLLVFVAYAFAGKCASSYIDATSGSSCVQPCDGTGKYYPIQFAALDISPYPLSQSKDTTLSLRYRCEYDVHGFGVDFSLESSPFFFLNQNIQIDNFCEQYEIPAEECVLEATGDWVELNLPFNVPSGPLVFLEHIVDTPLFMTFLEMFYPV